jgi:hypothetical protein
MKDSSGGSQHHEITWSIFPDAFPILPFWDLSQYGELTTKNSDRLKRHPQKSEIDQSYPKSTLSSRYVFSKQFG